VAGLERRSKGCVNRRQHTSGGGVGGVGEGGREGRLQSSTHANTCAHGWGGGGARRGSRGGRGGSTDTNKRARGKRGLWSGRKGGRDASIDSNTHARGTREERRGREVRGHPLTLTHEQGERTLRMPIFATRQILGGWVGGRAPQKPTLERAPGGGGGCGVGGREAGHNRH
jgi:hypothetical protein